MIRELQVNFGKNVPSTAKANVKVITGMGVVHDVAADTVKFPTAAEGVNVFMADKERIPTGRNTGIVNLSDYTDEFVTIEVDELCKRIPLYAGERYATDQVTGNLAAGKHLAVGTDGKWAVAGAGKQSRFVCAGEYDDTGHKLFAIEVLAAPVTVS